MEDDDCQKLREAVMEILKEADMETMTESKVRAMAASKTGLDGSKPAVKKFVKALVSEFLESLGTDEAHQQKQSEKIEEKVNGQEEQPEKKAGKQKEIKAAKQKPAPTNEEDEDDSIFVCELSGRRKVAVQNFNGKTLVSIRDYYEKNGKLLPTQKGISLTVDQWEALKQGLPSVQKAIESMM